MTASRPVVGLVLEQTLGHQTHSDNLVRILPTVESISPAFRTVSFGPSSKLRFVPGYSNWTVRAGLRTVRALRDLERVSTPDVLYFHTQVVATLATRWMKRIPSVVSLDATPRQYDSMAEFYDHPVGGRVSERLKLALNRRCFEEAAAIVAWSDWCRDSLVNDYGVAPEKVSVVPPGVDRDVWSRAADRVRPGVIRILFVGGDFRRKGGPQLIEAVRLLRSRRPHGCPEVVLDLVTSHHVPAEPWLRVHRGLTPNSAGLIELFDEASVFCLPTLAECLGIVFAEAGAAGLPSVASRVGGVGEIVRHGENGLLVEPGDVRELAAALESLIDDRDRRVVMGENAARLVADRYDASTNAMQLADLFRDVVRRAPRRR